MTNTEIGAADKIMLGSAEADAMYIGDTLMWPINNDDHDYSLDYFTIESLEDDNRISVVKYVSGISLDIFYSYDEGQTWATTAFRGGASIFNKRLQTGEKVILKCTTNTWATAWDKHHRINCTKSFKVYGNVMSLLYGDDFVNNSEFASGSTHNLAGLFYQNTYLVDASNLILPALYARENCYNGMFRGCTSLTSGPKILPATLLNSSAYSSMFEGCINLLESPEICATTLNGDQNMQKMFCMNRSNKITTPKMTKGPVLKVSELIATCYKEMFKGNGNLTEVTCLATQQSDGGVVGTSNSTQDWLKNCSETGIIYIHPDSVWSSGTSTGVPSGWHTQSITTAT